MSGKLPLTGGPTGWSKLRDFPSPFPKIWMKKPYVSLPTTSSLFLVFLLWFVYLFVFSYEIPRSVPESLSVHWNFNPGISSVLAEVRNTAMATWLSTGQSLWPLDDCHQTGMAIGFASPAAALEVNVLLGNSCSRGNLSSLLHLPSKHWMSSFLLQTALLCRWTETFSACPQMSGKLK